MSNIPEILDKTLFYKSNTHTGECPNVNLFAFFIPYPPIEKFPVGITWPYSRDIGLCIHQGVIEVTYQTKTMKRAFNLKKQKGYSENSY